MPNHAPSHWHCTLLLVVTHFLHCWILFAKILFRFFACTFMIKMVYSFLTIPPIKDIGSRTSLPGSKFSHAPGSGRVSGKELTSSRMRQR